MPSRDVYKAKLTVNGNTQRDRVINLAQKDIANNVVYSPSYKTVFVNEIKEQNLEIVATQADNKKRFTTMPNETVNLGDVITWKQMHWLVTKVDFDDEIVRRGEIEQCNRQIKWQNPDTLEIVERWCLVTKPYTSNIDEGKTVSTSNREYKIQIPYDNETGLVDLDKRFMLEKINERPRTYSVTSVDVQTNIYQDIDGGFLIWNVTQDQSGRPDDNSELWICDYINPNISSMSTNPSSDLLKCEIIGNNTIKIGGKSRIYTPKFYNSDGITEVLDGSVTPNWNLTYPNKLNCYFQTIQNEEFIEIKVLSHKDLIGESITLTLSDNQNQYNQSTLKIDLVVM